MENISKALLIAAGVFFAMMILSLMVLGYNKISSHYSQQQELLSMEQMDKFNKQFQNYNRGDIRGNELISLMNKVIDYNASQSYQVETGYRPIRVEIVIGAAFTGEFRYETSDGNKIGTKNEYITEIIQNTIDDDNNQANDRNLVRITSTPDELINNAPARA